MYFETQITRLIGRGSAKISVASAGLSIANTTSRLSSLRPLIDVEVRHSNAAIDVEIRTSDAAMVSDGV